MKLQKIRKHINKNSESIEILIPEFRITEIKNKKLQKSEMQGN